MEILKLNDTPVRTSRNFGINNIKLENIDIPERLEKFQDVEIISENCIVDDNTSNQELTYGNGKILEENVSKYSNNNIKVIANKNANIKIKYNFNDENLKLINNIDIMANNNINVIIEYRSKTNKECFHNGIIRLQAKENVNVNITIINILNEFSNNFDAIENTIDNKAKVNYTIIDIGAKNNIAKSLNKRGCNVTIYPCDTPAEEIIAANPDGIMLSNGPGDPKECVYQIEQIRKLYDTDIPIFAICLGHQLMALATGADTKKMKYGHRGGNHPVKDIDSGRVYISSQNHGYMVDGDTINPDVAKVAFVNVNDKTVEGLRYINKNIFTVQFHPEACPGPQDSDTLFDEFINMMEVRKNA